MQLADVLESFEKLDTMGQLLDESSRHIVSSVPSVAAIFAGFYNDEIKHSLRFLEGPLDITHLNLHSELAPAPQRRINRRRERVNVSAISPQNVAQTELSDVDALHNFVLAKLASLGGTVPFFLFFFHPITDVVSFDDAIQWTIKCLYACSQLTLQGEIILHDSPCGTKMVSLPQNLQNDARYDPSEQRTQAPFQFSKSIYLEKLQEFNILEPMIPITSPSEMARFSQSFFEGDSDSEGMIDLNM
ncbi:hypothetical protein P9112_004277 [Eukaryota sp. TZLM1-RC]